MSHTDPAGKGTGRKGFTLLEVLVALAVMAIAITLLLQLFSADLRSIVRSGDLTSAAIKGESRIREILADPSLTEKDWSEITEDGYRMDVAVSEAIKERTGNLPVRLMQVALTVRWLEGIRERSFSLKTLRMVDKTVPAGSITEKS